MAHGAHHTHEGQRRMSLQDSRQEFGYLIENEPPPLVIDFEKHGLVEAPDTRTSIKPID